MNPVEIIKYLEKADLKSICSELSCLHINGTLPLEGLVATMMRNFGLTVSEAECQITSYVISAVANGLLRDIRTTLT